MLSNCGKFKVFQSNCLNNSKSKVNTYKFPANSKLRKQWLFKMKRKEFKLDKNSRICAVHFTEDCFRENLAIRRFLVLISSRSDSTSKRMLCRLVFWFGKDTRGRMPPKHKGPPVRSAFAKRRKLEVCILHLSYST